MRHLLLFAAALFVACSDSAASPNGSDPEGSVDGGNDSTDGGSDASNDEGGPGDGPIAPAPEGAAGILYSAPNGQPLLGYSRVVRLAQGAARGTLLATFEHSQTDGSPGSYVIRKSTDDGLTWTTLSTVADGETGAGHPASTFYQPFLFELPAAMGKYPAGTLLLTGNVLAKTTVPQSRFQLWRSSDAGATWTFVTTYQVGEAADRRGIWEPFLDVDGSGRLVCYFADERRSVQYSQAVVHITSSDGGDTWSANQTGTTGVTLDVASAFQFDRPGMPTVATMPGGRRILAFELCEGARQTCEVRVKTSTDGGTTWDTGPESIGTLVKTNDDRYPGGSPYIVYAATGQLILSSQRVRRATDNTFAPEDYQALFINTQGGKGTWAWTPAPLPVAHEEPPTPCYMNYSPHLLMAATGRSLRYTTPSQDAKTPCAVRTATANSGVLPFASSFGGGVAAGWKPYGGCWKVEGGIYSDTCGGPGIGDKALAGSTGWANYKLEGDVRIDTDGANAGFLVRLTDAGVGIDAHHGYYVGIGADLFIGRQRYNYVPLGATPIPGGAPTGQFFHVTADVSGCTIKATAKRVGTNDAPIAVEATDPGCETIGAVGVRAAGGNGSFKDVTVVSR